MELIQFAVLLCALLCSLVAGLVLSFAVVVMPGIRTLGDRDFLKSCKAMARHSHGHCDADNVTAADPAGPALITGFDPEPAGMRLR